MKPGALSGIFPALTTPYDDSGALAVDRLRENIVRYNTTGVSGYLVVGSTGESMLLSREEVAESFAAVQEAAAPDKLLLAGTGAESTAETIARTKIAADLGYH